MFTRVYQFLPFLTRACLLTFSNGYSCLHMFTAVYSYLPVTRACLPMFTHVNLYLLMLTCVYPC